MQPRPSKPLRIGILARGLSESVGGVKRYMADIIKALAEIDQSNEYFIFYSSKKYKLGLRSPAFHEISWECDNKFFFDHIIFPKIAKPYNLDLMYFPKYIHPLSINIKSIITIHDLVYFPIPGKIKINDYRLTDTLYMRLFIPSSIKKADHIHVVSENTRDDIFRLFKVPFHKVSVIYSGVSSFALTPFKEEKARAIIKSRNISMPYIFYAGTLSVRKNVALILKSFAEIKNQIPHQLVITGSGPEKAIPFNKLLRKYGLENRVIQLGYVETDTLKALYMGADFFVFPSLYEGFGLTILEAMALGCPVICSNAASLPEVAGDAALLIDPYSSDSLKNAMLKFHNNPLEKESFIQKGLKRINQFSYNQAASELKALFEKVGRTP